MSGSRGTGARSGVPRVLMVTGAYYPELSGAGLQCRALINALGPRAECTVLTTAIDGRLPARDAIDGVTVHRVHVDLGRRLSLSSTMAQMVRLFLAMRRKIDIVHLHGFSRKSVVLVRLARATGKRIVIKLTSVGHDDPLSMQRRGRMVFGAYVQADAFVAVSPQFDVLYRQARMPPGRLRQIPNGVDLRRFRPAAADERAGLRRELGLPENAVIVLFVGFFSEEKAPRLLFDAWTDTLTGRPTTVLVFVGATRSKYFEVDESIADGVRAEAARLNVDSRLRLVERTDEIEKYYRAADVFAMPSLREGLPNALLEAMATGLPCVVSRLPGVTDAVIDDQTSGLLVAAGDRIALARELASLVDDPARRATLGAAASRKVERDYSIDLTAEKYAALYRELLGS